MNVNNRRCHNAGLQDNVFKLAAQAANAIDLLIEAQQDGEEQFINSYEHENEEAKTIKIEEKESSD